MSLSIEHKIELLTDSFSFVEIFANVKSKFTKVKENGDGVVCGYATIMQQKVILIIQNGNYLHGTMGIAHSSKMAAAVEKACVFKMPIIVVFESAGVRIQEGVLAMNAAGSLFSNLAKASGIVPTIAIMLGVNVGAASYSAALMDFIIMEKKSAMFLTGPKVIETVLNEKTTIQDLGGSHIHATITGLASIVVNNELEAYQQAKSLLVFLSKSETQYSKEYDVNTESIFQKYNAYVSCNFDMHDFIYDLIDENSFIEINKQYAKNVIVGFAKLNNIKIGIIANQPSIMSGAIDVAASKKMYRFLQVCDAYNVPALFIADTPGFLPGKQEEYSSILGVGARILSVLANSTNAKISLIIGKAFGGAYGAMCPKTLGADYIFAWHNAQIGVLGVEAAMQLIYAKEIALHQDDETYLQNLRETYIKDHISPYTSAENGIIDGVISPTETRKVLINSLKSLQNKVEVSGRKNKIILPIG